MLSPTIVSTIIAAFLASLVEVVEAFTIVLAVGLIRGWRPALLGAALGAAVLAILALIFGPLLALVPIRIVQFTVGLLLILFGMRWLRKAILRDIGVIALHDEEKAFARETAELAQTSSDRRGTYVAALASFKAVLLEGLEVIFIIIAVGATRGLALYASLGALGAVVVVIAAGIVVHRPLSQVPENTLKYVVGLMLTSFGIFWTGEGIGADWPGQDLSLLAIFGVMLVAALLINGWARGVHDRSSKEVR